MNIRPTDEQKAIIRSRDNCVINAGAGTGKTTTLIMYAKARPKARFLYIAFNKSIRQEAAKKFRDNEVNNIAVHTAHSLAFKHIKKKKVCSGFTINQIIEICGINSEKLEDSYILAKMIQDSLNIYCNSTVNYVDTNKLRLMYEKGLVDQFVKYAVHGVKILTKKMKAGIIPYTHDYYLKLFQLSRPKLPYTHILFDEGQDASPVMLDIFKNQHHATKVMVGDSSQAIYGYRMATNAMQSLDYDQYSLTESRRFGEYIARMANNILTWKKDIGTYSPDIVKINGVGGTNTQNNVCFLSRSNIGLTGTMIDQTAEGKVQNIYLEGGIKGYTFFGYNQSLNDLMSLYYGKHSQIKNPIIKSCNTVAELVKKAESIGDNELKGLGKLVQAHGGDLRTHIKHLKSMVVDHRDNASMIFSTVHKAKGLEYDEVVLSNDFVNYSDIKLFGEYYKNLGKKDIFAENRRAELNEEINILYVAATRTKNILRKSQ